MSVSEVPGGSCEPFPLSLSKTFAHDLVTGQSQPNIACVPPSAAMTAVGQSKLNIGAIICATTAGCSFCCCISIGLLLLLLGGFGAVIDWMRQSLWDLTLKITQTSQEPPLRYKYLNYFYHPDNMKGNLDNIQRGDFLKYIHWQKIYFYSSIFSSKSIDICVKVSTQN